MIQKDSMAKPYIHPTAIIEDGSEIQDDVKIWHFCHIRNGAVIEKGVSLGRDVYVDAGVRVGNNSRIQNGVSLYQGVNISPWCFIGPHVIFTNDLYPRAGNKEWKITETYLDFGASVGAGAVIRCGVRLGSFSMLGAGAIVTKSIPAFHLAMGFPAKIGRKICFCGNKEVDKNLEPKNLFFDCCRENLVSELQEEIKNRYL